ncbi:hypothetical protein GW17_00004408 [Ensete ventricosum]|nr:hypothetical protein GW17_00004408 [Ensete ventricosum]RZR79459.1 hypothetical protein BHM03_00005188 [Ensete ventricosum]
MERVGDEKKPVVVGRPRSPPPPLFTLEFDGSNPDDGTSFSSFSLSPFRWPQLFMFSFSSGRCGSLLVLGCDCRRGLASSDLLRMLPVASSSRLSTYRSWSCLALSTGDAVQS